MVSTPLPEVVRYNGLVQIATNEAGFVKAIEVALSGRSPSGDRQRVEAMREEGWDARVADMSDIIQARLAEAS